MVTLPVETPLAGQPVPASARSVSAWTPGREARAVQLYLREGFTAAEVAEALGEAFSRAAVIGKIRRLGFSKRQDHPEPVCRVRVQPRSQPRVERRLPPMRPPAPLPPLREVGATGAPRPLASLPAGACRWPIDDPGPSQMHLALFCAGPAADGVYCAAHRALAGARPDNGSGKDLAE